MSDSHHAAGRWRAWGRRPLRGSFDPPGDKSLSHRALICNALAEGTARVENVNPGADVRSTAHCLAALGVGVRGEEAGHYEIRGRGYRWRPATSRLDCGNSGTTARLLAGVLAGQDFTSCLDGDASLRARPMDRIARPLRRFGARAEGPDNGEHLPLIVTGPLREGGTYQSPVASAQVKSALLLAALVSHQPMRVEEPQPSRDHTEILLATMGARLEHGRGWAQLQPGSALRSVDLTIAGDPSAAAFTLGAAALVEGSEVRARRTLCNPTRSGFVQVLRRMGVRLEIEAPAHSGGEEVGDLCVAYSPELVATTVRAEEIPSLVDEVPLLAVLAAFARGRTVFEGIDELRHKESDRVAEMVRLLQAWSVVAEVDGDTLAVEGTTPSPNTGTYAVGDDHRLAMATAVLALGSAARGAGVASPELDLRSVAISDPNFVRTWEELQGGA